jgi:hypothetical protein
LHKPLGFFAITHWVRETIASLKNYGNAVLVIPWNHPRRHNLQGSCHTITQTTL